VTREESRPRDLLALARELLRRADPLTAGLWPRVSALLALRAVETSVSRLWDQRALPLQSCPMRVQLICLRSYLDDGVLVARAAHAWSALNRACHHHPYELAPTAAELESWFLVVDELTAKLA